MFHRNILALVAIPYFEFSAATYLINTCWIMGTLIDIDRVGRDARYASFLSSVLTAVIEQQQ